MELSAPKARWLATPAGLQYQTYLDGAGRAGRLCELAVFFFGFCKARRQFLICLGAGICQQSTLAWACAECVVRRLQNQFSMRRVWFLRRFFFEVWGTLSVGYTILMFWRLLVPVLIAASSGLFLSLCHATWKKREGLRAGNGWDLRFAEAMLACWRTMLKPYPGLESSWLFWNFGWNSKRRTTFRWNSGHSRCYCI